MKNSLILLITWVTIASCSKKNNQVNFESESYGVVDSASAMVDLSMDKSADMVVNENQSENKTAFSMMIPPPQTTLQQQAEKTDETLKNQTKKIIYTANIRFRVLEIKSSESNIRKNVEKLGGYITSSMQNRVGGNLTTQMTIRIPIAKFENFLSGSEKESIYTDFKNISSEDVSEEFYDNELRLKSKRLAFEKYLALLKQAKNVKEMLEVEEQLRELREEIESKEGRQKFINNQVAYSTIDLTIYQVIPSTYEPDLPVFTKIWENLKSGYKAFINAIIGLFYWLPFMILTLLIIYFIWKWRKSRKKLN